MCGICGILSPRGGAGEGERALVRRMCDAMTHRGPDGDGYFADDTVALGMRRLRIIDLVTGDQPIFNEDRTVVTVFNGEIYNFPEIRRDLEARGHRFATRTDTEVIVHLYEDLGEDFVHRLNGMFAIALWDTRRRTFILARDRLGIKPLHLMDWGGRLHFASEIKGLLESGRPREIDPEALSQFVSFEYIPAPRTIFRGITKIPPGHLLVARGSQAPRIFQYWNVRYGGSATASHRGRQTFIMRRSATAEGSQETQNSLLSSPNSKSIPNSKAISGPRPAGPSETGRDEAGENAAAAANAGARFQYPVPDSGAPAASAASAAASPRTEAEYAEEIHARLRESVRRRLISDVPLGVFLSGGIDSSTVTALMAEVAHERIKTFSIGFREKTFDEIPFARRVAETFGTDHTEFVVGSDQVRALTPGLMDYLDEPLADASIIPTYLISKLAREHVTVALAGDGGDELFCGYDTYKAWRIARAWRRFPRFVRSGLAGKAAALLPASEKRLSFEFKAKKFLAGIEHPPEIANTIWWGAYTPAERARLLAPEFAASLAEDPFAPIRAQLAAGAPEDGLDRICYLDLKMYLQDDLLVKVDRMSMANSLEIRVPFLDYTFVEFAASIPNRLKLKGLTTKHILKKAMAARLPADILTRKKIGFDIPLGPWLRTELRDFALDVLSPANLRKHGFFDEGYVRRVLDEHMSGAHNHRQRLWPLVIFQHWYDRYMGA